MRVRFPPELLKYNSMKNYFAAGEHRFASTDLNPNRNKPYSQIKVPVKQKCYGIFGGLAVMASDAVEARHTFNQLRRDAADAEMTRIYGDIDAATKAAKQRDNEAKKAARQAAKVARADAKAARQAAKTAKAAPAKVAPVKAEPVAKKASPVTTPAQRSALHSAWLEHKRNQQQCR